jgi:hypothetical protein
MEESANIETWQKVLHFLNGIGADIDAVHCTDYTTIPFRMSNQYYEVRIESPTGLSMHSLVEFKFHICIDLPFGDCGEFIELIKKYFGVKIIELTKWVKGKSENGYGIEGILIAEESERILSVTKTDEGVRFMEECDGHFSVVHSKEGALKLIEELKQWIILNC